MGKLSNKVALITGAARQRGIGRATALRLAQDGADVAVSGLPRDPSTFPEHEKKSGWRGLQSLVDEIQGMGRRSIGIDCDVTHPEEVARLVGTTVQELGGLDIIVNNASIPSDAGSAPIVEVAHELWEKTLAVNVNGVFLVSKFAAQHMIRAGAGGAIVNISSMAGRKGMPNMGAYCASKFGVIGITQQLALELAPYGIRVNCISPGSTDTDQMDGTFERLAGVAKISVAQIVDAVKQTIPLGRQGLPSEQASVIAFLAGPDASYVTGQTLNVDGGARMD